MSDLNDSRPARLAPLAGVAFAGLTTAGYLVMGKSPEPDASVAAISRYWGPHHTGVHTAAILLGYGALLFALFGAALWVRIRAAKSGRFAGAVALAGTAVGTAGLLLSAMTYYTLGDIAAKSTIVPSTLQALHVLGSELSFPVAGGVELLLLSVAVAGISGRAFPRWLAWTALVVGVLQLTAVGFTAFLVFLLWAAVAGLALVLPAVRRSAASAQLHRHRRSPLTDQKGRRP